MTDSEPPKDPDQTIVHASVVERVLDEASMVVEVRIAQFRAALAILLIIFTLQFEWQSGVKSSFTTVGVAVSLFALAFSVYVILTNRKTPPTSVVALAIFSIGLDATLMVLPVSIYFTTPEVPTILPMHSGALRLRHVSAGDSLGAAVSPSRVPGHRRQQPGHPLPHADGSAEFPTF